MRRKNGQGRLATSSEIDFPLSMMTHKRAVVAETIANGHLLGHLRDIVAAIAGANAVGEEKIVVPNGTGVPVGTAE